MLLAFPGLCGRCGPKPGPTARSGQGPRPRDDSKGIAGEDAVQFIHAMNANRFQEEQILKAQAIVLEAQGRGLPAKPIINKAFEGMAKQVPPERTLQAMGAVSSRYAFAFEQARSITQNTEQIGRLGNMLAESLAAGLKEQDASRIMGQLQEQSPKMSQNQMDELAAACLAMARDMSRLGVSSSLSSQVISSALSNGLNAASACRHASVHAGPITDAFSANRGTGTCARNAAGPVSARAWRYDRRSGRARRSGRLWWFRRRGRRRQGWGWRAAEPAAAVAGERGGAWRRYARQLVPDGRDWPRGVPGIVALYPSS
ncbi:MAG: hypothetical protein MZV70_49945 [Desulfobacterales bacterium]|nr:hypothetical protein [Desulfobacterales bacterium]